MPKTAYINLAVVRPIRQVMVKILRQTCAEVVPGIFRQSSKQAAHQLLERVFNQNEQAQGLFYLHEDTSMGIGESSVAFLRVSVALRNQHLETLLDARSGRLAVDQQAKLGWLVGNLFARPAAEDWSEPKDRRQLLGKSIGSLLKQQSEDRGPFWIEDHLLNAALEAQFVPEEKPFNELLSDLKPYRPKPNIDYASEVVENVALRIANDMTKQHAEIPLPAALLQRVQQALAQEGLEADATTRVLAVLGQVLEVPLVQESSMQDLSRRIAKGLERNRIFLSLIKKDGE